LERLIKPGQVFSMHIVTNVSALALVDTCALAEADALLHNFADGMRFMQLVEGKLRRRKVPCTVAARDRLSTWCPVSAQVLNADTTRAFLSEAPDHVDTLSLRPDGAPVVRDMLDLAPWRVFRGGLRLWAHGPGSVAGTLTASAPERTSQRLYDVAAAETLAALVLERLLQDGWRVGGPRRHAIQRHLHVCSASLPMRPTSHTGNAWPFQIFCFVKGCRT
jgi:hypothetical protein